MKKISILLGSIVLVSLVASYSLRAPDGGTSPTTPSPPAVSPPAAARAVQPLDVAVAHISRVSQSAKTASAQPIAKPTEITTDDGTRYPVRRYKPLSLPNDPGANQWWVTSTDMPAAWARGYGNYQTTVAVIDTGFALAHEDLAGRWATNSGEQGTTSSQAPSRLNCSDRGLPLDASCNLIDDDFDMIVDNESGYPWSENPSQRNCTDRSLALDKSCNLVDDDSNGYVDDVRGWDFVNFDSSVQAGENNPNGDGTLHGTMTSGTLGAIGNNGKGIAGVNWNTKILPIQAIDDDSYGDTLTLARSILYAVARDVDIISLSLGSTEPDDYVRQAVHYALANGTVVVAATGNESCDCIVYPARYPEVLGVGSYGANGEPSTFSNYGASLDILAPGEAMVVPAWSPAQPTTAYVSGAAGTSFATPYAAGILAQLKSLEPNASYGELIAALNESATHTGLSTTSPWSSTRGFGHIHAARATARVTSPSTAHRYQYKPVGTSSPLDSSRVYDCFGNYPSARLYELSKDSQITYTMSEHQQVTATAAGWASRSLGYQCVGQPIDTPSSIRLIDLFRETRNDYSKRPS